MRAETDLGKIMKQTMVTVYVMGTKKARTRLCLARPLLILAAWVAGFGGLNIEEDHGAETS